MKLASEILRIVHEGRADRYIQMFTNLWYRDEESNKIRLDLARNQIKWAIEHLKKEDAIVWYLRWVQVSYIVIEMGLAIGNDAVSMSFSKQYGKLWKLLSLFDKSVQNIRMEDEDSLAKYIAGVEKEISSFKGKRGEDLSVPLKQLKGIAKKLGLPDIGELGGVQQSPPEIRNWLLHSLGLGIPEIENFQYGTKTPNEVIDAFERIENEWKKTSSGLIHQGSEEEQYEVEDLITFPNGWKWLLKKTNECDLEGEAMGHCGNVGGDPNVWILSLREPTKSNDKWKVHCTFIWHHVDGGYIGEMKGKNNDKPIAEYHPYIVELLKDKRFTDAVGGGWLPSHNFSLADLSDSQRKEIVRANPNMRMFSESGNMDLDGLEKRLVLRCDRFFNNHRSMEIKLHDEIPYLKVWSSSFSGLRDNLSDYGKESAMKPFYLAWSRTQYDYDMYGIGSVIWDNLPNILRELLPVGSQYLDWAARFSTLLQRQTNRDYETLDPSDPKIYEQIAYMWLHSGVMSMYRNDFRDAMRLGFDPNYKGNAEDYLLRALRNVTFFDGKIHGMIHVVGLSKNIEERTATVAWLFEEGADFFDRPQLYIDKDYESLRNREEDIIFGNLDRVQIDDSIIDGFLKFNSDPVIPEIGKIIDMLRKQFPNPPVEQSPA